MLTAILVSWKSTFIRVPLFLMLTFLFGSGLSWLGVEETAEITGVSGCSVKKLC